MSLRHKKRDSKAVSESHLRKVYANKARLHGKLKPGQSSSPFDIEQLRQMARA